MTTSLNFCNEPIKVKVLKQDLELQLFMKALERDFHEQFNQTKLFNEWVESMENSIKKGEIHVG